MRDFHSVSLTTTADAYPYMGFSNASFKRAGAEMRADTVIPDLSPGLAPFGVVRSSEQFLDSCFLLLDACPVPHRIPPIGLHATPSSLVRNDRESLGAVQWGHFVQR